MKIVSKIMLICDDKLLFSIKRSPGKPEKHDKLELIGGGIKKDETPFQGLIRELYEEESTGILARKASKQIPDARRIMVKDKPAYIFKMTIDKNDIKQIQMDPKESLGYRVIHKSEVINDPKRFTPKTIRIFRSLGMI